MILFSLSCVRDHRFDSWFQSGPAYDTLVAADRVECPICGSTKVAKSLMAPSVQPRDRPAGKAGMPSATRPLDAPATELEQALTALRRQVEDNSEYVGMNFALEARAIHDGDVPARSIYGEARADEARKLVEDGVPVAPLPFIPARRTN